MAPEDHLEINQNQLSVLVSPRTREVLEALVEHGPSPASALQAALGWTSKAIYYQLDKLVAAGLVRLERRGGKKSTPDVFAPVASSFRIPDGYRGAEYERLAAKAMEAKMRQTIRRFHAAADRASEDPKVVDGLLLLSGPLRIEEDRYRELRSRLESLLAEYRADPQSEVPTRDFLIVFTPRLPGPDTASSNPDPALQDPGPSS